MLVPGAEGRLAARIVLALLIVSTAVSSSRSGLILNEFIRHFEPVYYDRDNLATQHRRLRRDVSAAPLRLNFTAHNRLFQIRLVPDSNIFADDAVFESTKGAVDFDTAKVYVGTLEDDEDAVVNGLVTTDGLFDGTVSTSKEDFFIEPAHRYLPHPQDFHSVVYRGSDVDPPSPDLPCASHLLHLKRREEEWRDEPSDDAEDFNPCPKFRMHRSFSSAKSSSSVTNDSSKVASSKSVIGPPHARRKRWFPESLSWPDPHAHVQKRATIDPKKTTCMLYLQADHLFFQKFGSEEACIEAMTRHVQRVNNIYKVTDFDQDGKPDNISFMIKRIKVHSTDALNDITYRFPGNYGVEKFLELFSEEDYDAFCLAYMFTYRDFEMGTLGLAWTGDLKNAGGVCEKNGHYRGSLKSLNTGIVTLLNYGKHVPPAVSHVTLAHEIGHNFGSPHDPELCTPGGEDGNFIMFARATSGDKRNNNKFSPCSLNSISPVLNAKARNPKGCFTEPQRAICGNGVVEDGEECDCGWEEDCRDKCCYPMRTYHPPDQIPCTLTPGSVCSPSQGPCCKPDCQLRFGDKCRDDNGCRDSSYCDGRGPQCPPSTNKPNKTICNEEFVCFMGECTGSICLAYGLESCQCIPNSQDSPTKACELCCKLPGDDQPCLSSFQLNKPPYDIPDMYAKPGTPCNDYNGYCDVFQKCREVDPSGPLATLRKLLLSDESIASLKKWIVDHWYAVLLIIVGLVVILVLVTKYLGKHPNMKLKSVTIIHSSTTETVRLPAEDGAVTIHPVAMRSKLPLKKKVRENRRRGKTKDSPTNMPSSGQKKKRKKSASAVKKTDAEAERRTKKKKRRKVIDYSAEQGEKKDKKTALKKSAAVATAVVVNGIVKTCEKPSLLHSQREEDPVGKVQNWLLTSQQDLPKSKSTPAGLTTDKKSPVRSRGQGKSRSLGNLPKGGATGKNSEKVKLQVVYKPPFKFSVKLRKPEVQSTVVGPSGETSGLKDDILNAAKSGQHSLKKKLDRYRMYSLEKHFRKNVKPSGRKAAVLVSQKMKKSGEGSGGHKREISPEKRQQKRRRTGSMQEGHGQGIELTNQHSRRHQKTPSGVATVPTPCQENENIHTVPSDLEVLLSESDFLFSDDNEPEEQCIPEPSASLSQNLTPLTHVALSGIQTPDCGASIA